jgi:hypothetical protein
MKGAKRIFPHRNMIGYEKPALFWSKIYFCRQASNMPLCYLSSLVGN